jgi:hypothetical protein
MINPYLLRAHCPDCSTGNWLIYNIGYPASYHEHTIRLCERHYRQAENAARHFELNLQTPPS